VAESLEGRVCPLDQGALRPEDEIVACSDCKTLHHAQCWAEHRQCTTHNCRGRPQVVLVVRDSTTDVRQFAGQLDEIRTSIGKLAKRVDGLGRSEGEATAKSVAELRARFDTFAAEGRAEAQRVLASLTDAVMRIRALDYAVSRQRFPSKPPR
jgi:hypothetical protein